MAVLVRESVTKSELVFMSKEKVRSKIGLHAAPTRDILTHLPLHLIDLAWLEHTLSDDAPNILVQVSIIVNDLGSQHECEDEKAVTSPSVGKQAFRC
jgi:hypothetical protein